MALNFLKIYKGINFKGISETPTPPEEGDLYYSSSDNKFKGYENGEWTNFKGNTGIQGQTGILGQTGISGQTGLGGIQGTTGNPGLQGETGIQGLIGVTGTPGLQGGTGLIGVTGTPGLQGETGVLGLNGVTGSQGLQGLQGTTGLTGDMGIQGIQGVTGFQGGTGIKGETGILGPGTEWKETILHAAQISSNYAVDDIMPAQVLVLTSNLAVGDAFYFDRGDGSWFTFTCYATPEEIGPTTEGFVVQSSINATLTSMETYWNGFFGGAWAVATYMPKIESSNNVLIMIVDGGSSPAKVYGNAGAAAKCKILSTDKAYTGVAADLVSLPSSAPSETNFGFYRPASDLITNEIHIIRNDNSDINNGAPTLYVYSGFPYGWRLFAAGAKGVTGLRGMTGVAGAQGSTGVQGIQGSTGVQGIQGSTGIQGIQGSNGATGVIGLQGSTGIQGSTGLQGIEGTTGIQGEAGAVSGQLLWFNHNASPDAGGTGCEGLNRYPAGNSESIETITVGNNSDAEVLVDPYITISGYPNTTKIPAGKWTFKAYSYVDNNTATTKIVFRVFKRPSTWPTDADVELFGPIETEDINAVGYANVTEYTVDYALSSDIAILATDRIIVKVFGKSTRSPQTVQLSWVYDGTTHTSNVITSLNVQGIQGVTGIQGNTGVQGLQGSTGVAINLTAVNTDILPATTNTYNIGSTGLKFKDLYLSGSTIYLGTGTLRQNPETGDPEWSSDGTNFSNVKGQTGPQGLQGITGLGAQGLQGVTGTQGLQGITGLGAQGVTGTSGTSGNQGSTGIQGLTGLTGQLPLTVVTGTSQTMAVNNAYAANNSSLVTFTLPSTAAVGSRITAYGMGSGGWMIAQNSGQYIVKEDSTSATGTGGYMSSNISRACAELVCTVANTEFLVVCYTGTFTIRGGFAGLTAGFVMGGSASSTIYKLLFSNETTSTSGASLSAGRSGAASGVCSGTKGYEMGGWDGANPLSEIQALTFSGESRATLSATLDAIKVYPAGMSAALKGYCTGGVTSGVTSSFDNMVFSNDTSAGISANLSQARKYISGASGVEKGYALGGYTTDHVATCDGFTYSNESCAALGGSLSASKSNAGNCPSSSSAGYYMGGYTGSEQSAIQKVAFSNDGISTISATLDTAKHAACAATALLKGYLCGGYTGSTTNVIENIVFSGETSAAISATLPAARSEECGVHY